MKLRTSLLRKGKQFREHQHDEVTAVQRRAGRVIPRLREPRECRGAAARAGGAKMLISTLVFTLLSLETNEMLLLYVDRFPHTITKPAVSGHSY